MISTDIVLKQLNRILSDIEKLPHFTGERNVLIREDSARMIRNEMMKRDIEIELLKEKLKLLENNNTCKR